MMNNCHLKNNFTVDSLKADLTNDDYNKAKQIWKHVGMKNMGRYHDLYLKIDDLLLTDVYEHFRNMC